MCRSSSLTVLMLATAAVLSGCGGDIGSREPEFTGATQPQLASPSKRVQKKSTEPIAVDWDILEMPLGEDNKFEPWMVTSRVQQLAGKRIRIRGLIYGGGLSQRGNIREFPLIREAGCQFGSGAPAWHVIMVELEGKLRTEYKTKPITLEGIFQVKPYNGADGKTWSVYFLRGTKVE